MTSLQMTLISLIIVSAGFKKSRATNSIRGSTQEDGSGRRDVTMILDLLMSKSQVFYFLSIFAHQADSGVRMRCSMMAWPLIPFAPVTKATCPAGMILLLLLLILNRQETAQESIFYRRFRRIASSLCSTACMFLIETCVQTTQTAV